MAKTQRDALDGGEGMKTISLLNVDGDYLFKGRAHILLTDKILEVVLSDQQVSILSASLQRKV